MAALSGERTFRLLQEDFKAMIDDGTIIVHDISKYRDTEISKTTRYSVIY